jgi:hypothetical protein
MDENKTNTEKLIQSLAQLNDDPDYKLRKDRVGSSFPDSNGKIDVLEVIRHFRYSITNGVVPDADALIFIANAFASYGESSSFCSLDEAFKLKSQKGTGRPTNKYDRQETQLLYYADMLAWCQGHPESTQKEAFLAVSADWALLDRLVPFTEETGVCCGSMISDTILGGNLTTVSEVFDGSKS